MSNTRYKLSNPHKLVSICLLFVFQCSSVSAFEPGTPLQGFDPVNDRLISSVLDHSAPTGWYGNDGNGIVEAYSGETGKKRYGAGLYPNDDCYKKSSGGSFILDGNYRGLQSLGGNYLCYDGHGGIDFAVDGELVLSVESGQAYIMEKGCPNHGDADCGGGFGNYIKIVHDNGMQSYYAHLSQTFYVDDKKGGVRVGKGVRLAISGNSGRSSAPHLHVEFRKSNGTTKVDPFLYWRNSANNKVTVYFEGTVIQPNMIPNMKVGDKFWGFYDLDRGERDIISDSAKVGAYWSAVSNVEVHVGSYDVSIDSASSLQIGNNYYQSPLGRIDYYHFSNWNNVDGSKIENWVPKGVTLQLVDTTSSALTNDSIPIKAPLPYKFQTPNWTYLSLSFQEENLGYYSSVVASFDRHYVID